MMGNIYRGSSPPQSIRLCFLRAAGHPSRAAPVAVTPARRCDWAAFLLVPSPGHEFPSTDACITYAWGGLMKQKPGHALG